MSWRGCRCRLGHYKEAREVYESVLAANPGDIGAVAGLVNVFLRTKDMADAHAVLDRASAASNSAQVWATLLYVFLSEKRLDEAASFAKSYVEKNPTQRAGPVHAGGSPLGAGRPERREVGV